MPALDSAKNIYRRLRRSVHAAMGRDVWAAPELRCRQERIGSAYGGWSVRPDWLSAQSVVYAMGVGRDVSFDVGLIERFGCTVHAFDPTPKSVAWVKAQKLPEMLVFHPLGVAACDGEATFVLHSDDPEWDSYNLAGTSEGVRTEGAAEVHKLPVRRVATIMKDLGHTAVDVLKIDIEGAEYEVVDDILASGVRPRQLLVEYHYFEGGPGRVERTKRSIDAVRAAGYRLFSRSAIGHEFSFCLAEAPPKGDRP